MILVRESSSQNWPGVCEPGVCGPGVCGPGVCGPVDDLMGRFDVWLVPTSN